MTVSASGGKSKLRSRTSRSFCHKLYRQIWDALIDAGFIITDQGAGVPFQPLRDLYYCRNHRDRQVGSDKMALTRQFVNYFNETKKSKQHQVYLAPQVRTSSRSWLKTVGRSIRHSTHRLRVGLDVLSSHPATLVPDRSNRHLEQVLAARTLFFDILSQLTLSPCSIFNLLNIRSRPEH